MIPKIIHYIWLGNKREPKILRKCKKSWKKFCPDYKIMRWDEKNLNIDINKYCRQAYDNKKYAFASDVLRFDILNKMGGIYVDIDVQMIKNFDEFLDKKLFMGFENSGYINPGLVMGAEKNNEHLKNLLDLYQKDNFINEDGSLNLETICIKTTNYLKTLGLKQDGTTQCFKDVNIYSKDYFCAFNSNENKPDISKNTHSVHLFYASWLKEKFFVRVKNKIKRIFRIK